jgi:hypothetical protein
MKSSPNFKLLLVVLGVIFVLSTGINLYSFSGIEDGIIIYSLYNNGLFLKIDQMKVITICTNLVGLLIISLCWFKSFQKCNEQDG